MKTRLNTKYVIIPIVLIAMLAVFSAPAMAYPNCGCDVETNTAPCNRGTSGVINGMVHVDEGVGGLGSDYVHIDFADIPEGTVKWARVYWHIWMPGFDTNTTFCNETQCWNNNQSICDPSNWGCDCSLYSSDYWGFYGGGCGTTWVYQNVTTNVTSGEAHNITIDNRPWGDGRVFWVVLVVVLENTTKYSEINYWVNQGYEDIEEGDTSTTWFNGPVTTPHGNGTLWQLDLCSDTTYNGIFFNGNNVRPDIPGGLSEDDIHSDWIEDDGTQNMTWDNQDDPWNHPVMAILEIPQGAASDTTPPYTTGHDPAKGATNIPPDTNITVHVKDDGTGVDQSTIEMTVEGEPVAPVITGTAADYTVTYNPSTSFDCGQVVDVTVDAADLNETPNVMTTDSYSFTIVKAATPFMIYGWVNDTEGAPVNDPDVNVTNLNTSEIYDVETNASFNYYQVITCSENVSAGDVLHFTAIKETTKEFNYTVEVADMNHGGFEQNITIEADPYPDMVITEINAYHYNTNCMPWFNMTNEIDVTVKNTGDINATEAFNVSLTIDDGYYARQNVPGGLNVGESVTLTFSGWKPVGEDCFVNCVCTDTCHDYTITGVADCDNDVEERYEENNATTISGEDGRACHNGYMADEPLENVEHGILRGRLNFTTGNGTYGGLDNVNEPRYTGYEITIPAGASLKLAKLNVYYTWHNETTCPQLKVGIANGTTVLEDDIQLETDYNDMKCQKPTAQWRMPWGNYVYNVTEYITGPGTYTVSVERTGGSSVAIAAPGIVYVYEDANEPTIEYWINEGADILLGGRRGDGGYLAWWECVNNATFPASTGTGDVAGATVGVVTPWGDSFPDDILFFNDIELGRGVYSGYTNTVDETIDGMSMYIGNTNAQVGVNMTDVTAQYVNGSENMVSQADDEDNMMPANAFLVVEYEEEVPVFYDYFTADDGPNVNESKWWSHINYQGSNPFGHAMSGRIKDNSLVVGNVSIPCDEGVMNADSNPTFKHGAEPLVFKARVRGVFGDENPYHPDMTSNALGFPYSRGGGCEQVMRIYFLQNKTTVQPGYALPCELSDGWEIFRERPHPGPAININTEEWHEYMIKWTGNHIYWYIDGGEVWYESVSSDDPLYVEFATPSYHAEIWTDWVEVYGGEMFDASPPGCSIVINDGAEYTESREVTLTLSAEDPESGVEEMRFANDNTQIESWSDWEPYATTKAWTLSEGSGEKKVYVKYKNGAGLESLAYYDTITLVPVNEPPVADPNGPYEGTEGVPVTFDGSGSYDPDGSIVSYEWDFGDGNTSNEESPTHTYTQDGTYNVTLTVTDNESATDTNSTTATIAAAPVVTTYDFTTGAGSDKWAYRKQHNTKPPATNSVPGTGFTSAQYDKIEVNEGTMQVETSSANGNYAIHRFKFDIGEPEASITEFDVLWDGAGYIQWGTRGATLYIWNFETGSYEELDTSTDIYITLEGTITDNMGDYIDADGNLIIMAEQNSAQWRWWWWTFPSRIGTDYVKVDITHT